MSAVVPNPSIMWHSRPRLCSAERRKGISTFGRTQPGAAVPHGARGFTLIEVLATVMLLAIIVPAINKGISVATGMASSARMRTEATGLAESKLNELLATGEWQNGQSSGDFSPDWPMYHWQSTISAWQYDTTSAGLQEIDVVVTYTYRNTEQSITVSSLTYVRADNSSTATGTGTSTP
jgi:prepilin-type N-terminal cleavage/methylation domain-containing protein